MTIDVIMRVRALASAAADGKVLIAVSLDITNAFNILPCIREALEYRDASIPPGRQRGLSKG